MSESGDDLPDDVHDAAAAAAVRRDAMTNLELADAIVRWEVRLAPLAQAVPPVAPPDALWDRIADSTGGAAAGSVVVDLAPRRNFWGNVVVWRSASLAALAVAAALAIVAFLPRTPQPTELAALVPLGAPGPAAFVARVSADGTTVFTAVSNVSIPADRDLELWILAPGAPRPTSLGVLPASGRTITLPGIPPIGAQLLVTLEQRGGSPTGQPTGNPIYGGALANG
jgi:anti-sigma-K factor RskA